MRLLPPSWARKGASQLASSKIVVLGAGGHAKVVISTVRAAGQDVCAVFDDDRSRWGDSVLGVPVEGGLADAPDSPAYAGIIAIGSNPARRQIAARFQHLCWHTVVHPSAYVDSTVRLGQGTVVFAGAVVQPDAVIGSHVIINTGATVDHDCRLADYVHVAPGTHLAGAVQVGEGALLGIGSAVVPGRSIGRWALVGAGGVVIQDVPDHVTVVGIPARPVTTVAPQVG